MEPFGVLKEIHLQRSLEVKEMAERPANNFVLLRRTKLEYRFQSLVLVALSLVENLLLQKLQSQKQRSVLPAESKCTI
jgi:hypothetical protein